MPDNTVRPKWWLLYLIFPLLIMLFVLDHYLDLSQGGHSAVQIGTILLIYGLVTKWIKTNPGALFETNQKQYDESIVVTGAQTYHMPEIMSNPHPNIRLPRPGLNGTLRDTFGMDPGEAEYIQFEEDANFMTRECK
jgi:hypothetical protein